MDNEDDGFDDQFDDELDDDEDEPKKKKRVATSTKIVLVVAGWILLTLFLVGEFSDNKNKPDTASAELQTTTGEFDDGGTPDIVDTEAEAEFDLDGDGFLDETERGAALEAFEASVEAGEVAIGESDVSDSEGGGSGDATYPGPDGATADTAVPGAAPSSGSGSSTTTTAKPSGGGGTTTSTPTSGGGGGGTTTTTTAPGGGGGGGATTTSTTAAPPPPPGSPPVDRTITVNGNGTFTYDPVAMAIPTGSRVKMVNSSNKAHTWKIGDAAPKNLPKDGEIGYQTFNTPGVVSYSCTIHPAMQGSITVG